MFRRTTAIPAAAAAAGLLAALPSLPAGAETSGALSCGSVVTTDVTLTSDITGCQEYGLVVAADGVTIDLNGFRITGAGRGTTRAGIYIDGADWITVRNGSVAGFALGVDAYQSDLSRYQDLDVRDTIYGIGIQESFGAEVSDSLFEANRAGVFLLQSEDAVVSRSRFVRNETQGLDANDTPSLRVIDNEFVANTFDGASLSMAPNSTVDGNTFRRNGLGGLYSIASDGGVVSSNVAIGNDFDGLLADGSGTTFRDNKANANGQRGIVTADDAIDAGGNRAHGNSEADCVGISC
jgi:parallel beta-helix repeat protein